MCGIAGWVDFTRDLRERVPALDTMVATMARRGPDAEGSWVSPHALLGHRRLAVIDLPGGKQPMTVVRDGRLLAVITYSGEVYNFRELRSELVRRGHQLATASDTEVVLLSYVEWGESFVDRLNGMFAFAIWDVLREQLVLARDRMGVKPLYYYPTLGGVVFGSEPKAILANPLVDTAVDEDGLREILGFVKTPGHGIYQGMYEVRPGQLVRISRSGISRRQYWQLAAQEHVDDRDTTVRQIRELLDDIVERQLISDVPLCVLLSGGLDSTAVTALAARTLAEQGRGRVRSFAVDFVGQSEHFTADSLRDLPDLPFAHEAAAWTKAEHSDVVLSSADLAAAANRRAALTAGDVPIGGELFTSLYLLFAGVREHSTVALSGESADELFGGYKWFHDPAALAADTFPWLAIEGRIVGDEADPDTSLLDQSLLAKLDLSSYQRDSYRTALGEVPHVDGADPQEQRMRGASYVHLTRFVQHLLDRKDRMSMASGLEVRVPFCDHRLVEYVFNAPWAMKVFDGREKSLLRAATRDLVPVSIQDRRKSPYPSTSDPVYEIQLRDELSRLLAEDAPVRPMLNTRRATALLAQPPGTSRTARRVMENILLLNDWLVQYRPDLRVGG
ncbi:MAG: asparagine synthase (glutamine-hydrolyzing) [Natronosporangium sp.]